MHFLGDYLFFLPLLFLAPGVLAGLLWLVSRVWPKPVFTAFSALGALLCLVAAPASDDVRRQLGPWFLPLVCLGMSLIVLSVLAKIAVLREYGALSKKWGKETTKENWVDPEHRF